MAAVKRLPVIHYSVYDFFWIPLWNFETITGLLKRPIWPKLASLGQELPYVL